MSACALPVVTICLRRGASVDIPLRFESSVWRYVPISAISKSAPVEFETAGAHDIPDRWRGVILNAPGMPINYERGLDKLRETDLRTFGVPAADRLKLNKVVSLDWPDYAGGAVVAVPVPLDLSIYASARMQVNDASGTQLAYFSTADGTLEIDVSAASIWLRLTPAQSAALAWDSGQYDIELVTASGDVKNLVSPDSTITVVREQTTDHP